MRGDQVAGWVWVVLSILTLLAFGTGRLVDTFSAGEQLDAFAARYAAHPIVSLGHIVPGLVFLMLAPLQFVARIRRRHLAFHRRSGRLLVLTGAVSGLFALVAAAVFPAFGGTPTQLATLAFGLMFLASLWMAVLRIRQRRVKEHREWMIRVFAIALGVATIRAVIGLSQAVTGRTMVEVFGFSFWVGFGINFLIAEWWIRRTRPAGA